MNDQWYDFWVTHGAGYANGVNMRSEDYDYKKAVEYINNHLHIKPEDNLLDVGCGNGQMLEQLIPYTHNLSGVDFADNQTTLAKALMEKKGGISGTYVTTSASSLESFKNNTFDIVISFAVIQYYIDLEEAKKAVKEMFRILKPNGRLYIGDIIDARKYEKNSYVGAFTPEELGEGYNYQEIKTYYEPEIRFDLLITK